MTLDPLLQAPLTIQVHAFSAMAAFALGLIQIIAPKGTLPHKALGALWIALMAIVAASAAFIFRPGTEGAPFLERLSVIHFFVPLTAFGVISGVWLLARGGPALKRHSRPFISVFLGGLVVAGALAFLPGRIMHEVAFGG